MPPQRSKHNYPELLVLQNLIKFYNLSAFYSLSSPVWQHMMGKTEIMRKTGSDHNESLHPLGGERGVTGLNSEGENKHYPYYIKQERLTWFHPEVSLSNWCMYMTSLGLWLICIRQTFLLWLAFFRAEIWLTIHGDRSNNFPLEISPPECNWGALAAASMCVLCLWCR